MNIGIIFAGGTGQRMSSTGTPKQLLEVNGKPILVYTLEHFQNNDNIDGIVLVVLESIIGEVSKLVQKYGLDKVKSIIPGGKTGQESIYLGIQESSRLYDEDSIVLLHDGVRPIISDELINTCISSTKIYGNAITVSQAIETIVLKDNELSHVGKILSRDECLLAKAPQCFYLKDIYKAHEKARSEDLEFIDSASMMQFYGAELFTVIGPAENIKITTPIDFYTFKAYLEVKNSLNIMGL